jgi:hypothetical protein
MTKITLFTISLMLLMTLSSCFRHFFRTNSQKSVDAVTLQKLQTEQKYFIVHFNNGQMALNKINIADNKMEADLIPVPQNRMYYISPKSNKPNFVKVRDQANALMEVHLYHPETLDSNQRHLSVAVSTFNRIDVYVFDRIATRKSRILSIVEIVGFPAAYVGLAFAVASAAFFY